MLDFKKKLHLKKLQIFFLKFQIICSVLETSFRQYILEFTNNKWMLFLALVFPITFSYQFLENSKYTKILSLLEHNLPGTLLQSNWVSWETFQKTNYLPISQNFCQFENNKTTQQLNNNSQVDKIFYQQAIKQIDYWGDFITFDFFKNWNSYQKNYLSGSIHKKSINLKPLVYIARDNINSSFYVCFFKYKKNSYSQKFIPTFQKKYYQLDEFPRKLNNIFSSTSKTPLFKEINHKFVIPQWQRIQYSYPIHNLESAQLQIPSKIIGIQTIENLKNANSKIFKKVSDSLILKLQINFMNELVKLQVQKLFYNKGYIIPKNIFATNTNKFNSTNSILFDKYNGIAAHQILIMINSTPDFYTFDLNSENTLIYSNITRRLMSGFNYPDLKLKDLISLTRQKNYSLSFPRLQFFNQSHVSDKLKIYFGSHFAYPTEYNNIEPAPIRLNLKYYLGKLEGNDSKTQYSGPVIQLKEETNKVYHATNWVKVYQNLQAIFHHLNPRQIQQSKFFGNGLSEISIKPSINELDLNSYEKTQMNKFYKQLFKRQELSAEKETLYPSLSYGFEFVVPYLNSQEWHLWLLNQTINSSQLPYIQSFPIRQLGFLKNNYLNQSGFDLLDYQNPTYFFKWLKQKDCLNAKLVIHDHSVTQAAISSSIVRQNYATVTYLKRTNQFKYIKPQKNLIQRNLSNLSNSAQFNSFTKRENWEPLHWSSWLVISQYVFAILVINLLRQFALSYGRELVSYLIDLFSSLGIFDSSFKEDLISEDSKYRIINKPITRFKNIAGIEQIFSQLSEIVWFLRNSKRFMDTGNHLPKGVLLVGPPGTGKTLLVQAIAGEAQIPIFLQPAGAFNTTESLGAQRLQKLFEKAKQLAPCIIFFDEIDSIGKRRSHIIQNPVGTDNLFQIVSNTSWQPTQSLKNSIPFEKTYITDPLSQKETLNFKKVKSDFQDEQNTDQLSLLMQLLIELDGLQSTKKIVIIGATNRLEVLDPALIRPGRFDKILKLELPKKYKRIQICQLYAQILGIETKIYWEYIGNKTFGLSGADLATIMNQSSIDAILKGTKHTMQTIELAIHKIIGDSTKSTVIEQHSLKKLNQNLIFNKTYDSFIPRLSYYQAGITAVKLVLPQFVTPITCSLFPKHENVRYKKVSSDFLTGQLQISRRHELKAQLIALCSGKISEFLYFKRGLITPNQHVFHSDYAQADLTKASHLIYQMTDHWYLYLQKYCTDKLFKFSINQNQSELLETKTHNFLEKLSESKEILIPSIEFTQYYNFQLWLGKSWWQIQVANEETNTNLVYANWYRIFLKNPDEVIDNDEWVMPDQYYHNNEIYFLTKTNHLNDIQLNQRDILYQTVLTEILDETFQFFHESAEFVDFLATFLIKNRYLRRFEMDHLYKQFLNQY